MTHSDVVTHSDGVPTTALSSDPPSVNFDQAMKPKLVTSLSASFYDQFLSTKSKERRPSPSEHLVILFYLVLKDISS